ncbi:acylphosphatase [Alkalibacillus silvisoli]|uniref:Acylphosphatase n=1 Tax=Alkalibacillus silvisoli TaxID=392823 RepID=A0ABP3K1R6_9BACI
MDKINEEWLPHLKPDMIENALGFQLDAYLMALEGWRRGLTLKWHVKDSEKFKDIRTWFVEKPGHLFSLSSKEKTHYFFKTRGDLVSNAAVDIGKDKQQTKVHLEHKGVRTPQGQRIEQLDSIDTAKEVAGKVGYPLVVKPSDGSYGRGVMTNINSEEELEYAVQYIQNKLETSDLIIEEYIPGHEHRLYVVGDDVVGAMLREPANVVGDGEKTIRQLIDTKNEQKKQNPRLVSCLIKPSPEMRHFIEKKGYSLQSILPKGDKLYLTDKSNISIGGDPVSVTDELPQSIKDTAVAAVKAVPGLEHGAVDVMIDESGETPKAVVLELNPTAQIGGLVFPMKGKPNDIPKAIIDHYFPETDPITDDQSRLYFDLETVLEPLLTRTAKVAAMTPIPEGKLLAKKYTVTGDVGNHGFHLGLRKQLFERYLFGRVIMLEDDSIEIVASGTDEEAINEFKDAIYEDPERSEIENVKEESYNGPLNIGVEIRTAKHLQLERAQELQQSLELINQELHTLEKNYKNYKSSFSWRVSYPIRLFGAITKFARRS